MREEIMEKWLFPDLKHTGHFAEGTTYMIAFDMEPSASGDITLKQYYVPPHPPTFADEVVHDRLRYHETRKDSAEDLFAFPENDSFFTRLFPYVKSEESGIVLENNIQGVDQEGRVGREGVRMMYYHESFIYFFLDHFSKNDPETAKATERFSRTSGRPVRKAGCQSIYLAHANQHRALDKRNGIHTMVSFGTKPSGSYELLQSRAICPREGCPV
ncbi:hypothetical protein LshimejAT787_1101980 [Lyophyllum shimeji]|uniref:Uncharacterized protein n=1 Tax=Lyophyllum shimeji TaxID=47721 RepID=A0A9P3PV72_LYOSH|nr:hypothetical protein LshimejAT787_1101980 [Lyophyllum shimeji]